MKKLTVAPLDIGRNIIRYGLYEEGYSYPMAEFRSEAEANFAAAACNHHHKLTEALHDLLDYTGGSDAPKDHPCNIARRALDAAMS